MHVDQASQSKLAEWVPMPRYLLRCWVVKKIIRSLRPKDFIEIGAASGDLAAWMATHRITGTAVEISPDALDMLRARLAGNPDIQIFDRDAEHLAAEADLLLSMEVLEHIEDDSSALANWFRLVRPGGHLLLTVPAHAKLFSAEDEMAGHFRRYERRELAEKIAAAGFEPPEILSYGFPIGILLKRLRTFVAAQRLKHDRRSREERTAASGVERKRFLPLRWMLNNVFFFPFNALQMPFLKTDWSDGYIAVARKPEVL